MQQYYLIYNDNHRNTKRPGLRSISRHATKIFTTEIKPERKLKKKKQRSAIHDNFIVGKPSISFAFKIPISTRRSTPFIHITIK